MKFSENGSRTSSFWSGTWVMSATEEQQAGPGSQCRMKNEQRGKKARRVQFTSMPYCKRGKCWTCQIMGCLCLMQVRHWIHSHTPHILQARGRSEHTEGSPNSAAHNKNDLCWHWGKERQNRHGSLFLFSYRAVASVSIIKQDCPMVVGVMI